MGILCETNNLHAYARKLIFINTIIRSDEPVDLLGATSQLKAYAEISRYNKGRDRVKVDSSYQQLMAKYQKSNEASYFFLINIKLKALTLNFF